MDTIQSLKKIRRDGQVIEENMTFEQIFALGTPEKVNTIQWEYGGRVVAWRTQHSMLATVLPGRNLICVIEELDDSGTRSTLSVVNGDGSLRAIVSNQQILRGRRERGQYRWFESARKSGPNHFGVIFRRDVSNYDFHLDIDGATGTVIAVYESH